MKCFKTNKGLNIDINAMDFEKIGVFFKCLGDATRMKILYHLCCKELSVNDIAVELEMNQSAISHQLKILKDNSLVKYRKDGKKSLYSIDDDHVINILSEGFDHIDHRCK